MTTPTPRVLVPSGATKGEVFQVRTIISHQMETGLRHDAQGRVIPRKIINRFVCRYGGVEVFSVDLHEAVSANPFIEFYLRPRRAGGSSSSGRRTAAAPIDWNTNSRSLDDGVASGACGNVQTQASQDVIRSSKVDRTCAREWYTPDRDAVARNSPIRARRSAEPGGGE